MTDFLSNNKFFNRSRLYNGKYETKYKVGKYKVKDREMLSFTKNVHYLLKGKINLVDCLEIVSINYEGIFREKIRQTKKLIEKGTPLNKAFEKIEKDREFLELIKIGEQTGNLETVFKNLYEKYEFRNKIKKDIMSLSIYPLTVIITALIIVVILLKFVVPKFVLIYSDTGQQLPVMTKTIIGISAVFDKYGLFLLILLIFLIWFATYLKKKNKEKFEKIFLNTFIIGKLYKDMCILNFTRNMYSLTSADIPFLQSLKMCINSNSGLMNNEIRKVIIKIEKGENIKKSFHNLKFFNKEYITFLNIGEKTGVISDVFFNLYEIYYEKVRSKIQLFLKIFEPLSIIFIAMIIGIIMLSVMLPIFKMGEAL
jgi:type II secretion system F domain protein